MNLKRGLILVGTLLLAVPAFAADETITLALGGKFCDLYPDAVKTALKSVPGVASVDLKSKKGPRGRDRRSGQDEGRSVGEGDQRRERRRLGVQGRTQKVKADGRKAGVLLA